MQELFSALTLSARRQDVNFPFEDIPHLFSHYHNQTTIITRDRKLTLSWACTDKTYWNVPSFPLTFLWIYHPIPQKLIALC